MKRLGILLASFLLMAVTLWQAPLASAASNTIGVNPRRSYTINPGDKVNDFIVVTNSDQASELNATINVLDFQAKDNTGTPSLNLKETKETPWSLKPYLSIATTAKVPAGKSVNVPYTITIPKGLGAGSYYSALQFTAGGNNGAKNVNLAGSAVSLFFVTVPGNANSTVQLMHFGAYVQSENPAEGSYNSFYSASPPKYIAYDLKNNGNLAEQPSGSILIKDMFGKQYKLFNNANPDGNIVLIGQTRRIKVCLNAVEVTKKAPTGADVTQPVCQDPSLKPGRYTVDLDLLYGIKANSQQELKKTAVFWYLPIWFIISVVIGLLLLAGVIWLVWNYVQSARGMKYRRR